MEISHEESGMTPEMHIPSWYRVYSEKLRQENVNLVEEVNRLSEMRLNDLERHLGGSIKELPYEFLQTLFIDGTDDEQVAGILRDKRQTYLKDHPEAYKGSKGASEGIVGFDGRVWSKAQWDKMTLSERQGVLVGSTCFHYESGTPGMTSNPEDFWNL